METKKFKPMIQPFIKTIDDLKQTVKVNASLNFTVMVPYLDDAYDKYIQPYLGEALVKRLSDNSDKKIGRASCRERV